MTNTITSTLLLMVLLFGFHLPSYADSVASGGGGGVSASGDMAFACQIAGADRLVLDAVAKTCQASTNAQGSMPPDNTDCGSPPQTGDSKSMAKYVWGGAASSNGSTMTVPSGLDCSGFVCAGSCRSGIPIQPGDACAKLTTAAMDQLFADGKSCYKALDGSGSVSGQSHLEPGDLIEYQHDGGSGAHTYRVNSVDPNDCHKVCIIQEESTKTGGGITCSGGATGDAQGLSLDDVIAANCNGTSSSNAKTKVMRYDPTKPNCAEEPPKQISNGQNCDVGDMPHG